MEFHEVSNVTLLMLFMSGLPLPITQKLVKNKLLITLSRIWGWFAIIAFPSFAIYYSVPVVFPDMTLSERIFNLLAGVATNSILFKLYAFFYNIPRFEKLIKIWNEFNGHEFYPQLRKELLQKRKKTTDRWTIGFGCMLVTVFSITSLMPFYTGKVEHPTVIPYSKNSVSFEALVIVELILTVSMCFFVHSYNCFLMQILAFEDALCNYLNQSLKIILTSLKVTNEGKIILVRRNRLTQDEYLSFEKNLRSYREICEETDNKMRTWVHLHQLLISFHDMLREIYEIPLCMEFLGMGLVICLVVFMMVSDSLTPSMVSNFVVYCINVYTIFYVTCFYGDLTELSSESLFRDAFGDNWFIYSRKIRIAYQLVIMRCRSPINLIAFSLYPLNSRSFATIFRHSYSFFMFLIQVNNRSKQASLKTP